jgi:hypothetical protein
MVWLHRGDHSQNLNHRKHSECLENSGNCSGFGFYIYNTRMDFLRQISFLYTRDIKQIIPAKIFVESTTSIFASGQGQCASLTVYSPLHDFALLP